MVVVRHSLWAALAIGVAAGAVSAAEPAPFVALLEDNAAELLPKLTNHQGGSGEGHVETDHVFSGASAVRIVPDQRYARSIAGWAHRIVEKPGPGEYRYLRLAWKAPGCGGIMIQLHDDHDWNIRYTAGVDKYGWGTRYVPGKPPEKWSVVTVDLFKDVGARTIRGMALTCFDGRAGYFDHIYLGRSIEDLDRIDATGFEKEPPRKWTETALEDAWRETSAEDAGVAYQAFWSLVHAPPAAAFLEGKLRETRYIPDAKTLAKWIAQLDDDDFATREEASRQLAEHARLAADALDAELKRTQSPEVKARIKRLLKRGAKEDEQVAAALRAVRILEYSTNAEAQAVLKRLADGPRADRVSQAAREGISRLAGRGM